MRRRSPNKSQGKSSDFFQETMQIRVRRRMEEPSPPAEAKESAEPEKDSLEVKKPVPDELSAPPKPVKDPKKAKKAPAKKVKKAKKPPKKKLAPDLRQKLKKAKHKPSVPAPKKKPRPVKKTAARPLPRSEAPTEAATPALKPSTPPAPRPQAFDDEATQMGAGPTHQEAMEILSQLEVVPRHRFHGFGTKGAAAHVQRSNLDAAANYMPNIASPILKVVGTELKVEQLEVLDSALTGGMDTPGLEASISPKRSLEHLVNDQAYLELSPKEQANLLEAVSEDPTDVTTAKSALALLKTGLVKNLGSTDRQELLELFLELSVDNRARIAQVAARKYRSRSILEDRDIHNSSLIFSLKKLVRAPVISPLMLERQVNGERVVNLLLGTLAHPERLSFEDGNPGVLGMLEYALAEGRPAEYVRLWSELISPRLSASLPGEEASLDLSPLVKRHPDLSFNGKDTPIRFALATLASLSQVHGREQSNAFMMSSGQGIDADVLAKALYLLFGTQYTVAAGLGSALRHLERLEKDPDRSPPAFITILHQQGERVFIFERLDDEQILVRAPHGRSSKRAGAVRKDPPRTVVDPNRSVDAIDREYLASNIGVALVPRV